MAGPSVLLVRETASLADSLQLLLETLGFGVVPETRVSSALRRLEATGREPIRAVIIACNQPRSEMLHVFPEMYPPSARTLPVIVVGDRGAGSRRGWPANVKFVRLPFETRAFLDLLHGVMGSARAPLAAVPPVAR